MHGKQGRDPVESGAVADAGRHGDDRRAGEAAEHARERSLHARDDDQRVGLGEIVESCQESVESGDADVGDDSRIEPVGPERKRGFVGDRDVARACGDDGDPGGPGDLGQAPDHASARLDGRAMGVGAGEALGLVGPGQQHRTHAVSE